MRRHLSPAVARPEPPPGVLAAGASVKVVAGDAHEGQVGIVYALLDDDGDGLTVSVEFKGGRPDTAV